MAKSSQNRTMTLSDDDRVSYQCELLKIDQPAPTDRLMNRIINQDLFDVIDLLPSGFADLVFADPPYNLTKNFNGRSFSRMQTGQYLEWLESWLPKIGRLLKPTGSIYICGDWRSSSAVGFVCEKYFVVRNRITFEREKGRGSKTNWKNNSEDIWFCTVSNDYHFNAEAVKLKRKVIAPYRRENGTPKDWIDEGNGKYRLTHPSNVWTDLTIPFWSMPENTPHPTQKPEKLLAKVILASSSEGDVVFDPFAGVGTTGVVAKKLGRNFVMIEIDPEYCIYAQKRLRIAEANRTIQGYADGVFWERNAKEIRRSTRDRKETDEKSNFLF